MAIIFVIANCFFRCAVLLHLLLFLLINFDKVNFLLCRHCRQFSGDPITRFHLKKTPFSRPLNKNWFIDKRSIIRSTNYSWNSDNCSTFSNNTNNSLQHRRLLYFEILAIQYYFVIAKNKKKVPSSLPESLGNSDVSGFTEPPLRAIHHSFLAPPQATGRKCGTN